MLRPPKFDPELVAELVIRIMTTRRDTKPIQVPTVSSGVDVTEEAAAPVTGIRDGTGSSGTVARNRLAKIQADAARARDKAATSAAAPATNAGSVDGAGVVGNQQVPSALSRVVASFPSDTGGACGGAPPSAGAQSGEAILVFLSGIQAINKVSRALRQRGILQKLNAEV